MIYQKNNAFIESSSPHSLGLQNNLTVPNPGWDQNSLLINEKKYWGANNSNGFTGLRGLTFDGTGLFGTGLFNGEPSSWGWPEYLIVAGFLYWALWSHERTRPKH